MADWKNFSAVSVVLMGWCFFQLMGMLYVTPGMDLEININVSSFPFNPRGRSSKLDYEKSSMLQAF